MFVTVLLPLVISSVQIPPDFKPTVVEDSKFRATALVNVIAYCKKSNVTLDMTIVNKTGNGVCIVSKSCRSGTVGLEISNAKGQRMINDTDLCIWGREARTMRKDVQLLEPRQEPHGYGAIQPVYATADPSRSIWVPMPMNQSYTARVRVPVLLDCEAAYTSCGPQGCDWDALAKTGKVHTIEFKNLKVFNLGSEECPSE